MLIVLFELVLHDCDYLEMKLIGFYEQLPLCIVHLFGESRHMKSFDSS
jgi:hypothetical protein